MTAAFGITVSNEFLLMQQLYSGKTQQSFPKYNFPKSFSLSANPKHFSNTEDFLKLFGETITRYVNCERPKLGVGEEQYALLILDVFNGQMTEPANQKMKENCILFVRIPANTANISQILDFTVNGSLKSLMKDKFTKWYR